MSVSASNNQDLFYMAIKTAFDNWTAYQLALTHNFGGSKTKEIAEWFLDATYQWIRENDDLEDYELEEFFEETMNTEFNSILEDNSAIQMARLLVNYNQMVKKNQLNELKEDLLKRFPNKSTNVVNSSIKVKDSSQPDEDSSSDEESDEDEANENDSNNNNLMNTDETSAIKTKKNQINEEEMQMVEEGWTYVAKNVIEHRPLKKKL